MGNGDIISGKATAAVRALATHHASAHQLVPRPPPRLQARRCPPRNAQARHARPHVVPDPRRPRVLSHPAPGPVPVWRQPSPFFPSFCCSNQPTRIQGIFIGDTHFPIQYSPENSIHELYLRASSATKKTAPLKLYANVVGKLAVERELANDLRDKIRESTQDAAAQRNNRTTVLLEAPLDLPPNNKKRKDPPGSSSMFRKPLRPADKLKVVPAPSNPAPLNKPAVPSASAQRDLPVPLRKRMIQCLAVSDRTEDHITKLVAGADPTAAMRRDVQDLLQEVRS